MRFLIVLAALLLSGCWVGEGLYTASDARPALPPGVYRMSGKDEPTRVFRVSMLPSGLTQFAGPEKAEVYGFAPLDRGSFVGWMQPDDQEGSAKPVQVYALIRQKSDGAFAVYAPSCNDEEAEIARGAGASIETGGNPACTFPTRASLEKAMRQFHPKDDSDALTLVRIGGPPTAK